ncbi:MAG TPA: Fic family protein [Actinomycetales bacterium]|nr:Fic family protein [Actinomycetales bacterium]
MPRLVRQDWVPEHSYGLSRRDRRGGPYECYVPDPLLGLPVELDSTLSRRVASAERRVRALVSGDTGAGLEGISRLLLRSEAIASSRIEGLAPAPAQVAIAELSGVEPVRGFSDVAAQVANNVSVLRRVDAALASAEAIRVDDVLELHRALFPSESPSELRRVQNWIGGSTWHPLDAEFVPPPPEDVAPLMRDLVDYANGATHGPLVQAALVHAQFETIHPFGDGNGRIGRALIHAVLRRRGLTPAPVLPVSMILHTWSDRYVAGLTAFRAAPDDPDGLRAGVTTWVETFVGAVEAAVGQAERIADDIGDLREEWAERVGRHRRERGLRPVPRTDSIDAAILTGLPEHPVLTTKVAADVYGTTETSARRALELLAGSGVVERKTIGTRTSGYLARDVLDLVAFAERRLASTRLDTREARPSGFAVPESPPVR